MEPPWRWLQWQMTVSCLNFCNCLAPGVIGEAKGTAMKCQVHPFSRATMTSYHEPDGYNNRGVFPELEVWELEVWTQGELHRRFLIVREISICSRPLWLIGAHRPSLSMPFPSASASISPCYKDMNHIGLNPHHLTCRVPEPKWEPLEDSL